MVKLITIKEDEKYLRQISKDVDLNDPNLAQNIADLKEYTLANRVYAMAGVQLGIPKRLLFIKSQTPEVKEVKEEDFICMINPKVVSMKGRTQFWEACRSGLGFMGLVERPYQLIVEYISEKGEKKVQKFEGFVSTVISHELDHLDGIFHMDRAKKIINLNSEYYQEEKDRIRKENGYNVYSEDCDFVYDEPKLFDINAFKETVD